MTTLTPLFGLCDINNAYCSFERTFAPRLATTAMVVLSANDGCCVARSAEVKALGVKMGTPWFKLRELAQQHGIVAQASNFTLYGDMSNRVMTILRDFAPDLEVYSIDEAFIRVESLMRLYENPSALGRAIFERMAQWLGLPVCVGFGESKTLAKLANHLAKKNPEFKGVCDLSSMSNTQREQWMANTDVSEIWGVGRRIHARLQTMGIASVRDLRKAAPKRVRAVFGVVMERTVAELNGHSCLALEEVAPAKQQIMTSRSFGGPVMSMAELGEAVATYVGRAAMKLRRQQSMANAIHVFIQTNRHKPEEPQYSAGLVVPFTEPTDDTLVLTAAAIRGLRQIYRSGHRYKRAGIMLVGLSENHQAQPNLFANEEAQLRSRQLMITLDAVNKRFGRETLRVSSSGFSQSWAARARNLSPKYTTQWADLPVAR